MSQLSGSGAVVTGAAQGIGKAIAARLVTEGLRVVINDLDPAATDATAREIGAYAVPGDAASATGIGALVEAARDHLGRIDLWCANAGVSRDAGLASTDEEWAFNWEVNTMAHVRAARLLVPEWAEGGGGRFVVTASAAGLLTALGGASYSATKHAAVGFAEWLSATYRHRGVIVHAICPEGVETAMLQGGGLVREFMAPTGVLTPEDVAEAAWKSLQDGSFLALSHPQTAAFYLARATDTDRWLSGMNKQQQRLEALQSQEETR